MRIKKSENIPESPEKDNKNPKKRAAGSHFPVAVICCIALTACLLSGCGKGQEEKKASEKSKKKILTGVLKPGMSDIT